MELNAFDSFTLCSYLVQKNYYLNLILVSDYIDAVNDGIVPITENYEMWAKQPVYLLTYNEPSYCKIITELTGSFTISYKKELVPFVKDGDVVGLFYHLNIKNDDIHNVFKSNYCNIQSCYDSLIMKKALE